MKTYQLGTFRYYAYEVGWCEGVTEDGKLAIRVDPVLLGLDPWHASSDVLLTVRVDAWRDHPEALCIPLDIYVSRLLYQWRWQALDAILDQFEMVYGVDTGDGKPLIRAHFWKEVSGVQESHRRRRGREVEEIVRYRHHWIGPGGRETWHEGEAASCLLDVPCYHLLHPQRISSVAH
jgi:hypothetical protein